MISLRLYSVCQSGRRNGYGCRLLLDSASQRTSPTRQLRATPFLGTERASFSSNSETTSKAKGSIFDKLRDSWNSGSILMGMGGAGIALLVVDRVLQYLDRREATHMMAYMKEEQAQKQHQLMDEYKDAPALFECTIKVVYRMGGTHGLKDAREGEVVQVLKEGVGPQGHYNLCRRIDEAGNVVAVGWYPIGFMEKRRKWWQWT